MHCCSLSEVLAAAGFCLEDCPEARHVVLEGLDIEPDSSMFGGSITIEKATDPRGERCTSVFSTSLPLLPIGSTRVTSDALYCTSEPLFLCASTAVTY